MAKKALIVGRPIQITSIVQCRFVIDLHQTDSPTKSPFFISKFQLESFLVFRRIFPFMPAVTYFDSKIAASGMTTLNYHLSQGGSGFGIELGHKGLCSMQLELGVAMIMKLAGARLLETTLHSFSNDFENIYTFDGALSSLSGEFLMNKELANFTAIKMGEYLGQVDGKAQYSDRNGMFVFLKHQAPTDDTHKGPVEVLRFIKKLSPAEITSYLQKQT